MEKQKQERERQLQWKAEMEREQKKKQQELAEKIQAEVVNNNKKLGTNGGRTGKEGGSGNGVLKKTDDPKKRLEDLLIGAVNKMKGPTPLTTSALPAGGGGECGWTSEDGHELASPSSGGKANGYV